MSYFDLNDVLSTQTRIPSCTSGKLANLGFLEPSSADESDLPGNSKLELPFWMTVSLSRHGLSVDTPKSYSFTSREILEAEAVVVDLYKFGPHFYDSGKHVMTKLVEMDDSEKISKSLTETLRRRFRSIMDSSQNSADCDSLNVMSKLDSLERDLFLKGQGAKRKLDSWFTRKTETIQTASLVRRHKKRKIND